MKKVLLVITSLLAFQSQALAHGGGCCTVSRSYLGIMPQFHKNYAGLRYTTRSYTMPAMYMDHGFGPMLHSPETTDRFTSVEAWARYYPSRKIQFLASVPYVMNQSSAGVTSVNTSGIGDAVLMANYAVFATSDSALCTVRHRLQAGGGIKLPTGKYSGKETQAISTPANFKPGSGSIDYLVGAQYTVRLNQLGFTSDILYKVNNQNKNGYRFGNQTTASGQFFYWLKLKQVSVLPSVGVYLEKSLLNTQHGKAISQTNGTTAFGSLGLDAYYKNLAIGGSIQSPFSRTENGMRKSDRNSIHISVLF